MGRYEIIVREVKGETHPAEKYSYIIRDNFTGNDVNANSTMKHAEINLALREGEYSKARKMMRDL